MKFLHLFNKSPSTHDGFAKIQGYENIKDLVRREFQSAFCRPTSPSNTLFLQDILDMKSGVYFDGSNSTNRTKIICIDGIDKMSRQFQNQLLQSNQVILRNE
jgi:hypothetical protein